MTLTIHREGLKIYRITSKIYGPSPAEPRHLCVRSSELPVLPESHLRDLPAETPRLRVEPAPRSTGGTLSDTFCVAGLARIHSVRTTGGRARSELGTKGGRARKGEEQRRRAGRRALRASASGWARLRTGARCAGRAPGRVASEKAAVVPRRRFRSCRKPVCCESQVAAHGGPGRSVQQKWGTICARLAAGQGGVVRSSTSGGISVTAELRGSPRRGRQVQTGAASHSAVRGRPSVGAVCLAWAAKGRQVAGAAAGATASQRAGWGACAGDQCQVSQEEQMGREIEGWREDR